MNSIKLSLLRNICMKLTMMQVQLKYIKLNDSSLGFLSKTDLGTKPVLLGFHSSLLDHCSVSLDFFFDVIQG